MTEVQSVTEKITPRLKNKYRSEIRDALQQFVSGLTEDRQAIFDSLQTIDGLAATTSQFLSDARPPLAADITALAVTERLSSTARTSGGRSAWPGPRPSRPSPPSRSSSCAATSP